MKRSSKKRKTSRVKGIFDLSKKINNIKTNIKIYKDGHLIHFVAKTDDQKVEFFSNFTINVRTNKFYTSVGRKNVLIGGIELSKKRSRHQSGGKKNNKTLKFQLDESKQNLEKKVDRSIEKLKLKNEHELRKYSAWTIMFMITAATLYYSGIVGKIFSTVDGVVEVGRDLVKVADKGVGAVERVGQMISIVIMAGLIVNLFKFI